jgi:hypothetical protein
LVPVVVPHQLLVPLLVVPPLHQKPLLRRRRLRVRIPQLQMCLERG